MIVDGTYNEATGNFDVVKATDAYLAALQEPLIIPVKNVQRMVQKRDNTPT